MGLQTPINFSYFSDCIRTYNSIYIYQFCYAEYYYSCNIFMSGFFKTGIYKYYFLYDREDTGNDLSLLTGSGGL